jgi:2OG-Fe(II) oxygenase superfamily
MIQLTRFGVAGDVAEDELLALRRELEQRQCIVLANFLEPKLLASLRRRLDQDEFYQRLHRDTRLELCLKEQATHGLVHFLLNDPALFDLLQNITGCGRIGRFYGRVYRMVPGAGHYDSWHDDAFDDRMITISINLSREIYRGGVLQIRERKTKRMLHEVANTGFGDAVVFRVDGALQHRVTDVEGEVEKVALSGWFVPWPDYQFFLELALQQKKNAGADSAAGADDAGWKF